MNADNFRFLDYEKLKRIVENAYDEIFVYDNDYKVVYVNKACERHYGMKAKELIGNNFFDLLSDDKWYPSVLPIVYKEKKQFTIEQTSYLGKKLITTAVPLFDENGDIEYVVMTVYDASCDLVNQRMLMEEEQKKRGGEEGDQSKKSDNEKADSISDIFFSSAKMEKVIKFSQTIAKFDSTVLIHGESGTGKTMLARYIHESSGRKKGSFLSINCSAIPEQLLESELFGYVAGAFTGAKKGGKTGLIELASFWRLNVIDIEIPALRERVEDDTNESEVTRFFYAKMQQVKANGPQTLKIAESQSWHDTCSIVNV
ncbi:PAS domain S-box-containing protein [Peptoclostridium litorale DSM 5388]|uniref:Putative sigma54 specific transcriptional regulator n=1 Tax=Peptoclostridium litorale DSM 5388 TaxID=1121324 RepID=A0A069RQG2_PEPLI|nr:sigma 54-interacting transcriptional regulator [Peptoclostridium litorale]KDR96412.1 putative sigma54 specific transcriptional regulator [Peptoclostridium litorale DSM 5388]SIN70894.1 PAS domain S-box-containing protein [Peptoclostridium litorale DSM 5388]